ncbi:MAG: replicative DNA helicase [Spirochaetales bacterium]|nr:replicative DNA helicase [Spirochaetales bacterium]
MFNPSLKDKIPPHNDEAERATIGAVLLNFTPEVIDSVQMQIRSEDFYKTAHRIIFSVISELYNKGEAVDILTLTNELSRRKELEKAGGPGYVSALTSAVPTSANVEYYAKIVKENSIRRRLIEISGVITLEALKESKECSEILEEAEKYIFDINDRQNSSGSYQTAAEVIENTVKSIEKRYQSKNNFTGIPSLFDGLDKMTSGFQNSEMIVIGARPSVGKTAFALTLACNIAISQRISCGFFTLEMSSESLMTRIVSSEAGIESQKLKNGLLRPADFSYLTDAAGRIYEAPLYIDDTPNIKLLELRSSARRMKAKQDIRILIVDYIGLISVEDKRIPRHEQMAEVSRSLKSLARELDIPVIALSQVGRQSEGRAPGLADLRESGAIEQDADMVMFLHRDRGIAEPGNQPSDSIATELIVAKNRNGPVGMVPLNFIPQYTRFEKSDGFQ